MQVAPQHEKLRMSMRKLKTRESGRRTGRVRQPAAQQNTGRASNMRAGTTHLLA